MESRILAYTGAIIDGEGCILINKNYNLRIIVGNTSKAIIDFLQENFLGNLAEIEAHDNNQKVWRWELNSNQKVTSFLEF